MIVVAGDLGGTKTLLQMAEVGPREHRVIRERAYDSPAYPQFARVLADFLAGALEAGGGALEGACFGIPGPVHGERARTTNLPWSIDARALEREFAIPRVHLVNDFQAIGYGIELLEASDLVTLQPGRPQPTGPRAVIGAGTGLGTALLLWDGHRYRILPSEGGHVDFGPTDPLQVALLRHLLERFGVVSCERVLSGAGLVRIHAFLCERAGRPPQGAQTNAAAVSRAALSGADPVAVQALDLFVRIYGAQAGNLALTTIASGGIYLAGGIAPKILDKLQDGTFVDAFRNKGPMRGLLEAIPVHVVTNVKVGLLGAAALARRAAAEGPQP